jgi:hypothetical protein
MAMSPEETKNMIASMLSNLEGEDMQGLVLEDLAEVMQHPKAAESVAELMPLEATSVQAGEPAPDFTLPYLPGSLPEGESAGATHTLSSHFGKRPVALIFGSYT